jgi:dnd system-associated protein 4
MSGSEQRVRRPEQHEALIQHLRNEGGFPTMRDILLFAAGVGFANERRVPLQKPGEGIRYEVLVNDSLADPFVSMLAAVTHPDDPEILDGARLDERVKIFEEYVNGGLEYIQEQANARHLPYDVIVRSLATEALDDTKAAAPASISDLLDPL